MKVTCQTPLSNMAFHDNFIQSYIEALLKKCQNKYVDMHLCDEYTVLHNIPTMMVQQYNMCQESGGQVYLDVCEIPDTLEDVFVSSAEVQKLPMWRYDPAQYLIPPPFSCSFCHNLTFQASEEASLLNTTVSEQLVDVFLYHIIGCLRSCPPNCYRTMITSQYRFHNAFIDTDGALILTINLHFFLTWK